VIHPPETLEAYEPHGDDQQRQGSEPKEESGPNPEVTEPRHHTARAIETRRMIRLMFDRLIAE
jgi:hypothetical protein